MSEDKTGLPPLVKTGKDTFGWLGVDLDGTLAYYDGWHGPAHIGAPVPAMHALVVQWLRVGRDVRIFTARVNTQQQSIIEAQHARAAIQAWCEEHFGRVLPITCQKDMAMDCLYDDRCVQVEANTGRLIRDLETEQ